MATNHRTLSCAPEDVFAVLANGWLYPSWVVGASRMRDVEPVWPSAGASIHHSFGVWPALIDDTTTMVEWDPPRHAVLKARGWPMGSALVRLDVVPVAGTPEPRCRVTITEDAVEGPGLLMPKPARTPMILLRNRETLQRLAYLAEGAADGK